MCMVYIHALDCNVQSRMGRNKGLDSPLPLATACCNYTFACVPGILGEYNLHDGGVKATFMIND